MTAAEASVRYRFAHFELQPDERRLLARGEEVRIGPHAFDLLLAFVERSGSLLTKDELLSRVWPRVIVEENTLQVHISSLRKVLGRDAIATVGDRPQMVRSLGSLGNVAMKQGRSSNATGLYEEAVALARELGDRRSIAVGLTNLGLLALELDDYAKGGELLEEAVSVGREFGRRSAAEPLAALGWVRFRQGDLAAARAHLTEGLEALREFGGRRGIAQTLHWSGIVSYAERDIGTARMQLRQSLALNHAMGDGQEVASGLEAFAALSLASATPMTAARLWGRAQRLREEIRNATSDSWRDAQIAAARRALQDDAAFDRAWDEGRSWTLDEAIAYAMAI